MSKLPTTSAFRTSLFAKGCSLLLLAGCAGVQYKEPPDSPLMAKLVTAMDGNILTPTELRIQTFNPKGCYSGYTQIPESRALRITPGKEVFIAYLTSTFNVGACRMDISFIPEEATQYRISTKRLGLSDFCAVRLEKLKADGSYERLSSLKEYDLHVRPGCIRLVPHVEKH